MAGALALVGCASTSPAAEPTTEAAAISITDAWVKSADEGMSAAFGILTNGSDRDVTIVSASSEVSSMLELHETVENDTGEMVMRQIQGGFVIPASGTFPLEPGANHIMLMDVTAPLKAGAEASRPGGSSSSEGLSPASAPWPPSASTLPSPRPLLPLQPRNATASRPCHSMAFIRRGSIPQRRPTRPSSAWICDPTSIASRCAA